jgi:hypothetical protein
MFGVVPCSTPHFDATYVMSAFATSCRLVAAVQMAGAIISLKSRPSRSSLGGLGKLLYPTELCHTRAPNFLVVVREDECQSFTRGVAASNLSLPVHSSAACRRITGLCGVRISIRVAHFFSMVQKQILSTFFSHLRLSDCIRYDNSPKRASAWGVLCGSAMGS